MSDLMYDASTKIPSSLITGNIWQLGGFDQCINIDHETSSNLGVIHGKHCSISVLLKDPAKQNSSKAGDSELKKLLGAAFLASGLHGRRESAWASWSVCVPSGCSAKDVEETLRWRLASAVGHEDVPAMMVSDDACQVASDAPSKQPFRTPEFVFMSAIVILVAIVLLCSLYDTVHSKSGQPGNRPSSMRESVIMAFSIKRSGRQLFASSPKDALGCLHGLRVLSTCWVVLLHSGYTKATAPTVNSALMPRLGDYWENMIVMNSTLSTDTFFLLSGLLLLRGFLRKQEKFNPIMFYWHRFIRLIPVQMILVWFYTTFLFRIGFGPLWASTVGWERQNCIENWWTNLLFVNNYVHVTNPSHGMGDITPERAEVKGAESLTAWRLFVYKTLLDKPDTSSLLIYGEVTEAAANQKLGTASHSPSGTFSLKKNNCMQHTWYLAVDMQLVLVSPLILIPLRRAPRLGAFLLASVLLASIAAPFGITYVDQLPPAMLYTLDLQQLGEVYLKIYTNMYTRAGPYLIGMFLAFYLHHRTGTERLPKVLCTVAWITAAVSCLAALFGVFSFYQTEHPYRVLEASSYAALHRSAWASGVAWAIFACVRGYGGIVNRFLSWSAFVPLSRLSFCVYMCHYIFLLINVGTIRSPGYFSPYDVIQGCLSTLVISAACSILLYVMVEYPVMSLDKIFTSLVSCKQPAASTMTSSPSINNVKIDVEDNPDHGYDNQGYEKSMEDDSRNTTNAWPAR